MQYLRNPANRPGDLPKIQENSPMNRPNLTVILAD